MDLGRGKQRSLGLLVVFALACIAGFVLVYYLTVQTTTGRLYADAALRGAGLSRDRTYGLVDEALGVVTVASLLAVTALVAFVAMIRLRRVAGMVAVGVLIAANVSTQVLKEVLPRPAMGLVESTPATLNSLPSGHSTAALSAVVALLIVAPARVRVLVASVGGAFAVGVALATMAAGWHRAADSVASFLLVGFWAAVAVAVLVVLDGPPAPQPGRQAARYVVAVTVLGLVLALVLLAFWVEVESMRDSLAGLAAAFGSSALLVGSTATGVLLGLLRLMQPRLREESEQTAGTG